MTDTTYITWLRTERLRRGLTQAQLAALLARRTETVCRWETGRRPVPHTARSAIDRIFSEPANA